MANANALMHNLNHEGMKHARKDMTPNRKVTSIKLKEEVKTKFFPVYNKSRKCSQVRLKYDAKIALKER